MSESTMRGRVLKALRPLDGVAVENTVGRGTPDVNFIGGWMELKWLRSWPKKADTIVRMPHFTPQQRNWLRRRSQRGGRVFLLLKVGPSWLLFDGVVAAEILGHTTRAGLLRRALAHWPSGLQDGSLVECISSREPAASD